MLTLSLKNGEGLQIGDDIRVTVSEIRPGRASLRLNIPDDVPVVRADRHGNLRQSLEQMKVALIARKALTV